MQFWDGRATTLEEQIEDVIGNAVEMDGEWHSITQRLNQDSELSALQRKEYGTEFDKASVIDALSEYVQALVTPHAPFDRYLRGDESAISREAKVGYETFKSVGCIACHQGQNVGGNLFQKAGLREDAAALWGYKDVFNDDRGRFKDTGRSRDEFVFRVPSLRNVTLTAPYFHDGSEGDLREAIRIMAVYQLGAPLAEEQVESIYAFLSSLEGNLPEHLK